MRQLLLLQKSPSESASSPARGASASGRGALAGGRGGGSAGESNSINSSGGNLPISDNNVSTTAGDGLSDCATGNAPVDWTDIGETDDINMAVAAAIGVGGGGTGGGGSDDLGSGEGRPSPRPSSNRIGQKQSVVAAFSAASRTSHLGEINRSIEKMSLSGGSSSGGGGGGGGGSSGGGCPSATAATTSSPKAVMAGPPGAGGNRRDSNWTSVSTEGYGSMRSSEGGGCLGAGGGGGGGRRCSELSAMSQASNLSTRANVNSPWDPISVGSSRRSSVAEAGVGATAAAVSNGGSAGAISHHIDRLRRRAQQKGTAAPQTAPTSQVAAVADGRQSAMSDCTVESQQPSFAAPRRASDPVRTLDRNFGVGVGGQMGSQARHGSYNQLNKQRLPPNAVMGDGARDQVSACQSLPCLWPLHIPSSSFISNY